MIACVVKWIRKRTTDPEVAEVQILVSTKKLIVRKKARVRLYGGLGER